MLTGGDTALDQKVNLISDFLGVLFALIAWRVFNHFRDDPFEDLPELGVMPSDYLPQWTVGIGHLNCDICKATAAKFGFLLPFPDADEKLTELCIGRVSFYGVIQEINFSLIPFLEIGLCKFFLGLEMGVERGFGDSGLLDDLIDPGLEISLLVKQLVGRFDNLLPCGFLAFQWSRHVGAILVQLTSQSIYAVLPT